MNGLMIQSFAVVENCFKWKIDNFHKEQIFKESHYGLKLVIPPLAVKGASEDPIAVDVQVAEFDQGQLLKGYTPVSCFYKIQSSRGFEKPIELHLKHNSLSDDKKELVFLTCKLGDSSKGFTISRVEVLIKDTGVLKLSDASVYVAIACPTTKSLQRSYSMLLLYQPLTTQLAWNIKVVITQNLGPYLQVYDIIIVYNI